MESLLWQDDHRTMAWMTGNKERVMTKLTTQARKKLSKSQFAFPQDKSYPIEDESHARNALARGAQFLSAGEQAKLRAKVHRKFPNINIGGK